MEELLRKILPYSHTPGKLPCCTLKQLVPADDRLTVVDIYFGQQRAGHCAAQVPFDRVSEQTRPEAGRETALDKREDGFIGNRLESLLPQQRKPAGDMHAGDFELHVVKPRLATLMSALLPAPLQMARDQSEITDHPFLSFTPPPQFCERR